ncbi:HNH endonuclease [Brucella ciceri]|uniref:HNH endonuclease n=1 Tax=Brucella ciceri TaxID=391287 RepID=UPI0035BC61BD
MANRLVLDAMIRRADFWQKGASETLDITTSAKAAASITFENLRSDSNFVLSLRKPDFQRETNQWSVAQAVTFIQSFIDGDLVPSVILWQSDEGFIFAIDGAHRVSCLRAWIEDDYGDGPVSIAFFGGEIPSDQKKAAKAMRLEVEKKVGSYRSLKDKLAARANNPDIEYDLKTNKRLKNLSARQLELQWVTGDAEVAEASFFKINTQGTPLDKTEESLLRNRNRAPAIAARSIVRAATGHKYWSKFQDAEKKKIEKLATDANFLLFQPEIGTPIKTLQLPLGGSASTLDALSLLIKLLSITEGNQIKRKPTLEESENDADGTATIATLERALATLNRMSGNGAASLGLHPAVYFYSDRGKYLPDLFLGMAYLLKGKLINNDSLFFKKFTDGRAKIEKFLVSNKPLVTQILQQMNSRVRTERVADILDYLVSNASEEITIEGVANAARLKGSIIDLREKVEGKAFSDPGKSAILIRSALTSTLRCPICDGMMEPSMSVSYDHILRKEDGGTGDDENGQLCHPYCNTGYKN